MSLPHNIVEAINVNRKARWLLNLRTFVKLIVSANVFCKKLFCIKAALKNISDRVATGPEKPEKAWNLKVGPEKVKKP